MRKRILALAMTTAMVLGGTACGGSDAATESASTSQAATEKQNTGESENGDSTHIYVLTAPEDHGWTGSVATFAKEKIEEVNAAGTYTSELITSAVHRRSKWQPGCAIWCRSCIWEAIS